MGALWWTSCATEQSFLNVVDTNKCYIYHIDITYNVNLSNLWNRRKSLDIMGTNTNQKLVSNLSFSENNSLNIFSEIDTEPGYSNTAPVAGIKAMDWSMRELNEVKSETLWLCLFISKK